MDFVDRKILSYVQERGRDSLAEVAAAAGLSVSAANERLKKLQARGVIRGWGARVDPRAVGRGVLAFTYVAVQRQEAEAGFVAAVAALPEVQECHHLTGEWSYLLKLRLTSIDQLERVLAGAIKAWPVRTHTVIALSSAKESAFVPCDPPDTPDGPPS